jgi:glycosyltransferase involved in cell wall biosynthesis
MNIGHFSAYFMDAGGIPSEARFLAQAQAELGHKVTAYCYAESPSGACQESPSGVIVKQFPRPKFTFSLPVDLGRILRENSDCLDVLQFHGSFQPQNIAVARTAGRAGIPYVASPEGILTKGMLLKSGRLGLVKKLSYIQLFERPFLLRAAAIRALSKTEVDHLRFFGVTAPCFIATEGIHRDSIHQPLDRFFLQSRLPQLQGKFLIGFMGRLDIYQKGLDVLLQSFADALRQGLGTEKAALVLIGPDFNGGMSKLLFLAKGLGVENGVFFVPRASGSEKFQMLASLDLFVHLSRREGVPRVLREALAVGCPVLITAETNMGELTTDYEAGWVVPPDPRLIAEGICTLVGNRVRLESMRKNALRLASGALDWLVIARQTVAAYTKIAGKAAQSD